jgi:hypothetical protein
MARSNSNSEFIQFLKREQLRQINFYKRTQVAGFILASAGLLLYIFEAVYRNTTWMILAYMLAAAWIGLCWFVVRPFAMKRKMKSLQDTISRLESLSNQITPQQQHT